MVEQSYTLQASRDVVPKLLINGALPILTVTDPGAALPPPARRPSSHHAPAKDVGLMSGAGSRALCAPTASARCRQMFAGVVFEAAVLDTCYRRSPGDPRGQVAVFQVLLGRDSGWRPQTRNGISMSFSDALRFHWRHTVVGVLLAFACWEASLQVMAWMAPVIVGLILLGPLELVITGQGSSPGLLPTRKARSPPAIIERQPHGERQVGRSHAERGEPARKPRSRRRRRDLARGLIGRGCAARRGRAGAAEGFRRRMSRARIGGAAMNGRGRQTSTAAAPMRAVSAPLNAPSPNRRESRRSKSWPRN